LLTCDETAELLRCSRRTVERRIAEGELEIVRNGRRVLVTADSLERFLASNTYSAASQSPRTVGAGRRRERRLWLSER
jgi:excisionase family DNA binding protein